MTLFVRALYTSVLLSGAALAGPRTLALASGDCRDPELLEAMGRFGDALATQLGADAVDATTVLERFRPRPTSSLEEVQRLFDAAQTQFYSSQYDQALQNARDALSQLERMPPSASPWKLTASARLLEGLVLKALKKKPESTEAFRRLLRLEPDYALDPDYFTPATIAQFEQVRKETAKLRRVELQVTSLPAGAEVVLDGRPVGTTPFKASYLPGTYRLMLARGEVTSFAYEVKLEKPEELQVDFGLEGALRPTPPLCVTAGPAEGDEKALKLAARVGVERAVVFKLESRSGEPGFASASLVEVNKGTRVRDGGLRLTAAKGSTGLAELASFVLTGASRSGVVALGPDGAPEAVATAVPALAPGAAAVPPAEVSASGGMTGGRVASLVLMGAGAATAIAGLSVYVSGGADRDRLDVLLDAQGALPPTGTAGYDEAVALIPRVESNNRTSVVLAAVGGAVAVTGVVLFFALPGSHPRGAQTTAFFCPSPGGAVAGVSGRF